MAVGVLIERRGEQYVVTVAAFHDLYEAEGFKIVSNEDGTKYEGDKGRKAPSDGE